jgi:hypothetical protein
MHVRRCPDCGEEFRPDIVDCSDCGALLVDADDERPASPGEADTSAYADASAESAEDQALVFSSLQAQALREAADTLAAAGIRFRASSKGAAFHLFVFRDQWLAATEALAGRDGAIVLTPEAADGEGPPCPACGATLAPGAVECPECQLVLGGEEADPSLRGPHDQE